MDASEGRKKVRQLQARLAELLDVVVDRAPVLDASLYEHRIRCGKPTCKCAAGDYRHAMWCVSFVEDGKSRTRVVQEPIRQQVEALTSRYAKIRRTRRELQALFEQMLACADALQEARCRGGRKFYARLAARAKRGSSAQTKKRNRRSKR